MTSNIKKKSSAGKNSGSGSNIGLWLIGISVLIVAIVVGFIVFGEQQARSAPVAQPEVPAEWIVAKSLGNPDAPVVIQLWEDFLCPSCQAFSKGVKPQIIEEYVKTGKARLEFHHFPLTQHEPGSSMSALASECAADQNYFWPYHDKIFQMASVDQQGAVQYDDLVGYARDMGLDVPQFESCLASSQHRDDVTQSVQQAQQMGLSFTPSIIVNDTLLQDSSYPSVKLAIEAALGAQ